MKKQSICLVFVFLSLAVAPALLSGCGDDEDDEGMPKTLEGAKDRIRTLAGEIARLNAGIKSIEDEEKVEQADLRLLVSQLRQENADLTNAARLGERIKNAAEANDGTFFFISIGVNFLSFLVIVAMQLRHRRLLDECNHYITHTFHG